MPSPIAGAGGGVLTPGTSPPLRGPGERLAGPGMGGPGYGATIWPSWGVIPGAAIRLPLVLTPGIGPNGPGPIDSRLPETSVGARSSVPYSYTNGYATPNGVTGFIGPAAGSLRLPIAWYVRSGGSNLNGGTSTSLTPDRTGTDGVINATTTFTSATAAFTSADVGKGIAVGNGGNQTNHYKIATVVDSTTIRFDRINAGSSSGRTWSIGGAWADIRAALSDINGNNLDQGSPVATGDTVYVGAGTFRNVTAFSAANNWPAAFAAFNGVISIVGDVTGHFTGDAGMVQLTAYTTNDKTAPSSTVLMNLGGKSNLVFSNIMFVGGNAIMISGTTLTSQNISFVDCALALGHQASQQFISLTTSYGTSLNWLFNRCHFFANGSSTSSSLFTLPQGPTNHYDVNVIFQNCSIIGVGGSFIRVQGSGSGNGLGGGIKAWNCFGLSNESAFLTTLIGAVSTVFPCQMYNSFWITGPGVILNAGTAGQIIEDYNVLVSNSPRVNVNIGIHSVSDGSYAPLFHFGQERIWGGLPRAFGEPMANSPLLGFGNNGQTNYDLFNRPRPAGGGIALPAAGALERSNTAVQVQSPVPPSGTNSWQFTGPAYQDFAVAVDTTPTTFSISVQRDSSYSSYPNAPQNAPSIQILSNASIGVTGQEVADTSPPAQWNTLTCAAFTATAIGIVTVRIHSYDGSGVSNVQFSDFAAA